MMAMNIQLIPVTKTKNTGLLLNTDIYITNKMVHSFLHCLTILCGFVTQSQQTNAVDFIQMEVDRNTFIRKLILLFSINQ